jgi:hypothetical protein
VLERDALWRVVEERQGDAWVRTSYFGGELAGLATGGTVSGTVTARAFAIFMDGKSDPEVVVVTLQPARKIRELRAEYDEMAGSLMLVRTAVDELKSALGLVTLKDGATLAAAVRPALEAKYHAGFLEGRADVGYRRRHHDRERHRPIRTRLVANRSHLDSAEGVRAGPSAPTRARVGTCCAVANP